MQALTVIYTVFNHYFSCFHNYLGLSIISFQKLDFHFVDQTRVTFSFTAYIKKLFIKNSQLVFKIHLSRRNPLPPTIYHFITTPNCLHYPTLLPRKLTFPLTLYAHCSPLIFLQRREDITQTSRHRVNDCGRRHHGRAHRSVSLSLPLYIPPARVCDAPAYARRGSLTLIGGGAAQQQLAADQLKRSGVFQCRRRFIRWMDGMTGRASDRQSRGWASPLL